MKSIFSINSLLKTPLFFLLFTFTVSTVFAEVNTSESAAQYAGKGLSSPILLTKEEQAWLDRRLTVRVRVGNAPPYHISDPEPQGISVDYLKLIGKRFGINFSFVKTGLTSWSESLNDLTGERKLFDLLLTITRTPEREKLIAFTQNYLSSPWVIINRTDSDFVSKIKDLNGKKVAVERGFVVKDLIENDYPQIIIVPFSTSLEALQSVVSGGSDAYISNLAVASYIIQDKGLSNLKVAAPTPFGNYEQAMGVRKDWPELTSIINKALMAMSDSEKIKISNRWLSIRYEHGVNMKMVLIWIGGLVAVFLLVMAIILIWNRQLKREIVSRQQAEAFLRKSELEFRLLAEAMPQIVWITRPDGWNIYFNKQWEDYTGLTLEESYGHGWNKPFHPDDQQRAWDAWQNATKNMDTYSLECRLRGVDGSFKWWLIRGVPVLDENGTVVKWFGTCTDIDEIKQAEVQLLQAKTAAESANQAKSQFLTNMSHEIRTPMNGIIAISQLLQMTEINEEQREYTELLITSGNNLMKLITDILDLSRIETGRVDIQDQNFDLSVELLGTVHINSLLAKEKSLGFEFQINPDVPLLLTGDIVRLRQIIINLIGNAIKFTTEGSISLHVSKEKEDEHNAVLRFQVRDSGIGIAQNNLGKIFDAFTQADSSTSITYGGTGLGLAIARHLVNILGGSIGVESKEGQGSSFWFTVVMQKQPNPPDIPVVAESIVESSDASKDTFRILLVEDDEANQYAFNRLLSKTKHQVEIAENGREALKVLEEMDFDVVLMDCRMPVMDGYEATAAIRNQSSKVRNHAIPIIALTANALREERKKCLDAGMDDYLAKPIDFQMLIALMNKWVKQQ